MHPEKFSFFNQHDNLDKFALLNFIRVTRLGHKPYYKHSGQIPNMKHKNLLSLFLAVSQGGGKKSSQRGGKKTCTTVTV